MTIDILQALAKKFLLITKSGEEAQLYIESQYARTDGAIKSILVMDSMPPFPSDHLDLAKLPTLSI